MDTKKWWTSKGLWGGVVGFIAMALLVLGVVDISVMEQTFLVDQIISIVTVVGGLISILVGIYGRITAKKSLTT